MTILTQYSQIDPASWDNLLKKSLVTSWFQSPEAFRFFDSLSFETSQVVHHSDTSVKFNLIVYNK